MHDLPRLHHTANRGPGSDRPWYLQRGGPIRLNLGCGSDVRGSRKNWLNVADKLPGGWNTDATVGEGAIPIYEDVHAGLEAWFRLVDLDETPWPWGAGAATYILASHVLEHLDSVPAFLDEAHRVLAPGGVLEIRVPHWRHANAHQDPTHRHTFTPDSMDYFLTDVPDQLEPLTDRRWRLLDQDVDLAWDATPARWRHWYRRLHRWTDGKLCSPKPREIRWHLTPIKEHGGDA